MKNKKIQKVASGTTRISIPSIESRVKRMEYYVNNYIKLLDQDLAWSEKRREHAMRGEWDKAEEIEEKYMKPISQKIHTLASQALKEFEHDKKE